MKFKRLRKLKNVIFNIIFATMIFLKLFFPKKFRVGSFLDGNKTVWSAQKFRVGWISGNTAFLRLMLL